MKSQFTPVRNDAALERGEFPLLVVIDKAGTARYIVDFVSEDEFDENGKIDRLVRQLIHERNPEP